MSPQVGLYTEVDADADIAIHAADLDAHTRDFLQVMRIGEYFGAVPTALSSSSVILVIDTLYAGMFVIPRDMTFDRIAIHVQTAGAGGTKGRLGIYEVGTNLYPGALVVDAGEVSVASTGVKSIVIDQSLTKGLYFLAMVTDGTPKVYWGYPTLSPLGRVVHNFSYAPNGGWTVAHGYAALPDPFTGGGSLQESRKINIFLRLSSLD